MGEKSALWLSSSIFLEQNAPKAVVERCLAFLKPPNPPSNRTYSLELRYGSLCDVEEAAIIIKRTHRLWSFAIWLSLAMKSSTASYTSSASAVVMLGEEKKSIPEEGGGKSEEDGILWPYNNLYPDRTVWNHSVNFLQLVFNRMPMESS